jgi:hypothetical protein
MHELPDRIGKQEDVECAECSRLTMHTVLAAYRTYWENNEVGISGGATHEFLRCNGCAEGTYRIESWFSEEPEENSITLYPPRGGYRRKPRIWREVPYDNNLPHVYDQTITAFNAGLFTLAGAGVRLLIEGVCIEQKVNDGPKLDASGKPVHDKKGNPVRTSTLEGKINGLSEQAFISPKQADHLHQIRFLGNDAAHQLDIPTAKVLGHAIDIVEHLLDQVYEQPAKAKALAARKRPKK